MAIQAHSNLNNSGFPSCVQTIYSNCIQQLQQQQREQSQQVLRQGPFDPNLLLQNSNQNSNALNPSPSLAIQLEKQWEEIDQYIRSQNEQLRSAIQEQGKQHVAALLKNVESHSHHMLREKDEQIAQAARKRTELEEILRKLEAENQAWKKVAEEKEAITLALENTLEEKKRLRGSYGVANDAESCCDVTRGKEKEKEEDIEQIRREGMLCKSCHSRRSCVLFLPCRHLSSCKACNAFLEACPVCKMPKKASIETVIF